MSESTFLLAALHGPEQTSWYVLSPSVTESTDSWQIDAWQRTSTTQTPGRASTDVYPNIKAIESGT